MKIPRYAIIAKEARAEAFTRAGLEKIAEKLHSCTVEKHLVYCGHCHETWYVTTQCRQRTCPICAWRVARDRGDWLVAMTRKMSYPKKLELTMPAGDGTPRERIALLRKKINQLRAHKIFAGVKGGAYQIELKWNNDHWHIHCHMIFDGPFIDQRALAEVWGSLWGLETAVVYIRACPGEAELRYAVKYACKVSTSDLENDLIVQWYDAVKGSRLFTTFGTFYNFEVEQDDVEADEDAHAPECPYCHTPGTVRRARDAVWAVDREFRENFALEIYCGKPDTIPNDDLEIIEPSAEQG
jgi:hypothetical protein